MAYGVDAPAVAGQLPCGEIPEEALEQWCRLGIQRRSEHLGYLLRQRALILDGTLGLPWRAAHPFEKRIGAHVQALRAWRDRLSANTIRAVIDPKNMHFAGGADTLRGAVYCTAATLRDVPSQGVELLQGLLALPHEHQRTAFEVLGYVPAPGLTSQLLHCATSQTNTDPMSNAAAEHAVRAAIRRRESSLVLELNRYLQSIPSPDVSGAHAAAWGLAALGDTDATPLLASLQQRSARPVMYLAANLLLSPSPSGLSQLALHLRGGQLDDVAEPWMLLAVAGRPDDVAFMVRALQRIDVDNSATRKQFLAALAAHGTQAAWAALQQLRENAPDASEQQDIAFAQRWIAGDTIPRRLDTRSRARFRHGERFLPPDAESRRVLVDTLAADVPAEYRQLAAYELILQEGVSPAFDCHAPVWQQEAQIAELRGTTANTTRC